MTSLERIDPEALLVSSSYAQLVRHGDTVWLAGQVGVLVDGQLVGPDALAQTEQIYENMAAALAAVGGTLDDLVRTCTYVVGRGNVEHVRAVRRSLLKDGRMAQRPASTLVLVDGLAEPGWLVEVEGVAVVAQGRR